MSFTNIASVELFIIVIKHLCSATERFRGTPKPNQCYH